MTSFSPIALLAGLMLSGAAMASDDCHSPMANWKSKEAVTAHVTQLGITTERLRIDDGCYEVRGRDRDGNRVELKIDPTSLGLLELEVRFQKGSNPARYLPGAQRQARSAAQPGSVKPQTAPATATRAEIQ